jgi:hypothetical protein
MKVTYNANGEIVYIDADESLTIAALKAQLHDRTGISPEYQEVCEFNIHVQAKFLLLHLDIL